MPCNGIDTALVGIEGFDEQTITPPYVYTRVCLVSLAFLERSRVRTLATADHKVLIRATE
jgi:hypothetical protein